MDWWQNWTVYHAAMFSLDLQREAATFAVWRSAFADCTEAEMRAATLRMAQADPPRYRNEHLAALRAAITAARHQATAVPDRPTGEAICKLCNGPGLVIVPNLQAVHAGIWTHRTAEGKPCHTTAVTCACPLGHWIAQHSQHPPMDLDEYASQNPDWQWQLIEDHKRQLAESRARYEGGQLDRTIGEIITRAREAK